jgi:hypothetical protein|tara:strand:- start:344 stop:634 length:291 start_codon:yes stop_codon:yes gene_type:complete
MLMTLKKGDAIYNICPLGLVSKFSITESPTTKGDRVTFVVVDKFENEKVLHFYSVEEEDTRYADDDGIYFSNYDTLGEYISDIVSGFVDVGKGNNV